MTRNRYILTLVLFLLSAVTLRVVIAHEGEEGGSNVVGPDKAILAADVHDGIRLAPEAVRTLELHLHKVSSDSKYRVPSKAIVRFQDEAGVYRYREGWFKLIDVKVFENGAGEVSLTTSDLKEGDQVVVDGVPLLRVAELSALGGSEEGHGH